MSSIFIKKHIAAVSRQFHLLFGSLTMCGADKKTAKIIGQIDIAPVWSVHQVGPPELLTRDGIQYVAYFDHDRFLTLAQRELGSHEWQYRRFPVQMGWQTGGHAKLSLALDRLGYIHITCYRRGLLEEPPIPPRPIYYRSVAPHSIDEFDMPPFYLDSPDMIMAACLDFLGSLGLGPNNPDYRD